MKTKHLITAILFAASAATAAAAGIESLAGKSPSRLLKQDKPFAKIYRAAINDQDLPEWTQRLAVGFPSEVVEIEGKKLILTSACSPKGGCLDERMYVLYAPDEKAVTAFFFLAPNPGDPSDHRMALSRWLGGVPLKARSDFLLQRALEDTRSPDEQAAAKEAEAALKASKQGSK